MDFLSIRRQEGGKLSTPVTDRRNMRVNDENQVNLMTPQRSILEYHQVSPVQPLSHGKSVLLSGAKRILPNTSRPSETQIRAPIVNQTKHDKNHYMKPTEAYQHAIEEASLTPQRNAKKTSFSLRNPIVGNTPNTLNKTFKKSKPSVTPQTPVTMEQSGQKQRLDHEEETLENSFPAQNDHLRTPVRGKSPAQLKSRSESTPPTRAHRFGSNFSKEQDQQVRSRGKDASSVSTARTTHSYMDPTAAASAKKAMKNREQKNDQIASYSETILFSPQSLLRRSSSASRLDALLANEKPERPVSAPKPRPSPFSFALNTGEIKDNEDIAIKPEVIRAPIAPAIVTPEVQRVPPATPGGSVKAPKSAKKPSSSGFTAEQLSAYKARKRAIMAVGSNNASSGKSQTAGYAAPTVSTFIRVKESQVTSAKKGQGTPSVLGIPKSNSKENVPARFSSPIRRTTFENNNNNSKPMPTTGESSSTNNKKDRYSSSPTLLRERKFLTNEEKKNASKIDANKLLQLVDAVERSVSSSSSPTKTTMNRKESTEEDQSESPRDDHFQALSTLTPSNESKIITTMNFDALFESYNESSNILNMSIEDSSSCGATATTTHLKTDLKVQRSFEGDISSVPGGLQMMNARLDEVSFQESIELPDPTVMNHLTTSSQKKKEGEGDKGIEMNFHQFVEDSKKMMEENQQVMQTVNERMMNYEQQQQNQQNKNHNHNHEEAPPPSSTITINTTTVTKMNFDFMNISAIEPTAVSPHSFTSMSSISTFGEKSVHRRPFSPVSNDVNNGFAVNPPAALPASGPIGFNLPKKRSSSTELYTPRFGPEVLNLSTISRSNSVHCLPTPTVSGQVRSETPLLFENNLPPFAAVNAPPYPMIRSNSNPTTAQTLPEVSDAWTTEYISMLQESAKTIHSMIPAAVQFKPLDSEEEQQQISAGLSLLLPSSSTLVERKLSITDCEVEYINRNHLTVHHPNPQQQPQQQQQNNSSSTMDDSSNNPLNTAMILSGSSLGIFSTSAVPSAITVPAVEEALSPALVFTPTINAHPSHRVMMPTTTTLNPISMMEVAPLRVSLPMMEQDKENMSPTAAILSTRKSPFFDAAAARTPLQTIQEEKQIEEVAIIVTSDDAIEIEQEEEEEEENEDHHALPTTIVLEQQSGSGTILTEDTNATSDHLNDAFLKDSATTAHSSSAVSGNSSEMISSPRMNAPFSYEESRSHHVFSPTSTEITPQKQSYEEVPVSSQLKEGITLAREETASKARKEYLSPASEDNFLPTKINSSFEMEPRKLNIVPVAPMVNSHNLPLHSHHVKAVDYESIEKIPLSRSTTSRGSGSISRSATRRSILTEPDLQLSTLPSVPIPPLRNNYLRDNDEDDEEAKNINERRLVERIEMSDDVVKMDDCEEEDRAEEEEEPEKEPFEVNASEASFIYPFRSNPHHQHDEDDSSMIEMNESVHSLTADINMSNKSIEFPSSITMTTTTTFEGKARQQQQQQLSELIKGLCEAENTLTSSEQFPVPTAVIQMKKKIHQPSTSATQEKQQQPQQRENTLMKKLLTNQNNSNSSKLTTTMTDFVLLSAKQQQQLPNYYQPAHALPSSSPPRPSPQHHHHPPPPVSITNVLQGNVNKTVEMSVTSEDRSSSSYTSSIDELGSYNSFPTKANLYNSQNFPMMIPSSTTSMDDGTMMMMMNQGFHLKSEMNHPFPSTQPPQISLNAGHQEEDEDMDLTSARFITHREGMNPALSPSPRTKQMTTIISPDPVASQLMLNNRRHINERNIKMMEQTFMTVTELNNSR